MMQNRPTVSKRFPATRKRPSSKALRDRDTTVSWAAVERLAEADLTDEEIAAALGYSVAELAEQCPLEQLGQARARGTANLYLSLWEQAMEKKHYKALRYFLDMIAWQQAQELLASWEQFAAEQLASDHQLRVQIANASSEELDRLIEKSQAQLARLQRESKEAGKGNSGWEQLWAIVYRYRDLADRAAAVIALLQNPSLMPAQLPPKGTRRMPPPPAALRNRLAREYGVPRKPKR